MKRVRRWTAGFAAPGFAIAMLAAGCARNPAS